MTTLACVPLDDRPVSTDLPQAVCAVAGASLTLPPTQAWPRGRQPGDADAIGAWVTETTSDAFVVSLEGLTSGGLVASRTGHESLGALLGRLDVLRPLDVPVRASVVVPRTPDTDDAAEEPEYWDAYGRALHALSAALHTGRGVAVARDRVPPEVATDWARRRLRQHQLALAALDMVASGILTGLIVGVDDAATASLSVPDADHIAQQAERLGLGDRVTVGHGADEATAVMCARSLLDLGGAMGPAVAVDCGVPGGLERTAVYESAPVRCTVLDQLHAAGAVPVGLQDEPDVVLVVHPPDGSGDWAVAPPTSTDATAAQATAEVVRRHLDAGRRVAVADVAQPNGADPALVLALADTGTLLELAGWAAWNTAGNTVGTVAAHVVASHVGRLTGRFDEAAHRRLLAARLVEDWAWMSVVRAEVRARTGGDPRRHDHVDPAHPALHGLDQRLQQLLTQVGGGLGWTVAPGAVRLPWHRTFEVQVGLVAG